MKRVRYFDVNFFTAVSKKLLNSFDKCLSSDIRLSWSAMSNYEHSESLSGREGLTVKPVIINYTALLFPFFFIQSTANISLLF